MKRKVSPGTAARTLGKLILAVTLVFAAVAAGFGGTAFLIYHQLGGSYELAGKQNKADARPAIAERKSLRLPARPQANAASDTDDRTQIRPVAASSTDRPTYTYADNRFGASDSLRGRDRSGAPGSRATTMIPAPLASPERAMDNVVTTPPVPTGASSTPAFNDPESRFIVDSRTGRIIGIDGSAGAAAEARQQDALQQQRLAAPAAMAARPVQTPPPEVRVATPVAVKRAIPVTAEPASGSFSAADELAQDDLSRPVMRAQAVLPPGARVVKTVRIYRLPDGSQTAVRD